MNNGNSTEGFVLLIICVEGSFSKVQVGMFNCFFLLCEKFVLKFGVEIFWRFEILALFCFILTQIFSRRVFLSRKNAKCPTIAVTFFSWRFSFKGKCPTIAVTVFSQRILENVPHSYSGCFFLDA